MRIEWPQGSGRAAEYSDEESEFLNGFQRQFKAGQITREEMLNQITAFHDLKVEFGVEIANRLGA